MPRSYMHVSDASVRRTGGEKGEHDVRPYRVGSDLS